MPTQTCTSHCQACGRHFHGDTAFDLHRAFADPAVEDWATRICLDPEGDADRLLDRHGKPKLRAWTRHGTCKISRGRSHPQHGVTIWQGTRDTAADYFGPQPPAAR